MEKAQTLTAQDGAIDFDLIIIGGGLAGASLACALKKTASERPLKIAVVEAHALNSDGQPSYDDRTIALSYGSRCIFDSMGLWPALAEHAEAIDNIHISDRGHFGVTRLSKQQEGVSALGYVLENRRVGEQLYKAMNTGGDSGAEITLLCPAEVLSLQQHAGCVEIEIRFNGIQKKLNGRLLVAADGNNSQVMQLLCIGSSRHNYQQTALISNVTPGKKHHNVAYERFTDSGPLALLPMQSNRCSLVWTVSQQQAEQLCALDDQAFLAQLQQRFGYRLGQFKKVGKRQLYPLFLQAATQMVYGRVVIIGNAAHSVHPVAGQGFNLALRDAALLAELVTESFRNSADAGRQQMLQQYVRLREQDIQRVYRFTDALVKTFSNAITPLAQLRSLALLLVDIAPDIKHQLALQSMGLAGRLSRLNRGLDL